MFSIDPAVFTDAAIAPETRAINQFIIETTKSLPDKWQFPPQVIRDARRAGRGIFPLAPPDPRAEMIEIDGHHGPITLRMITPQDPPKGVYLHIHGGGWMFGASDLQDDLLGAVVDKTGFAVVSVDYRLAPENPYPQGPDDCETAALWLVHHGQARFGTSHFAIGGESAGAHLSLVTLLRLRNRHGLSPFAGANLVAGLYDMNLTPSVRAFGNEPLILTTFDTETYARTFLNGHDRNDPDVSPIFADLSGLPHAHFSIGTQDCLLDDTLFMASRWVAAGNRADLKIYPGGCHVFQNFDFPMGRRALDDIWAFLRGL